MEERISRKDNMCLTGGIKRSAALFEYYFRYINKRAGDKLVELGYDPSLVGRCAGLIFQNKGSVPNFLDPDSLERIQKVIFPVGASQEEIEKIPVLMTLANYVIVKLGISEMKTLQNKTIKKTS